MDDAATNATKGFDDCGVGHRGASSSSSSSQRWSWWRQWRWTSRRRKRLPDERRRRRRRDRSRSYATRLLGVAFVAIGCVYVIGLVAFFPSATRRGARDSRSLRREPLQSPMTSKRGESRFVRTRERDSRPRPAVALSEPIIDPEPPSPLTPRQKQQQQQQQQRSTKTRGVIVLGMHRSGTSMMSGLMVMGLGYRTGGPLIGGASDNPKGFFERTDVVNQNDAIMLDQKIGWDHDAYRFDSDRALRRVRNRDVDFADGNKALSEFFLAADDPATPYLQKDPRMCITLPVWTALLEEKNETPAVVFTYRHPLDVANSLHKRQEALGYRPFPVSRGLRLWIVYNQRALENSRHLCRVVSSNDALLEAPKREIERVAADLARECGVPAPPRATLDQRTLEQFFDPKLQHTRGRKNRETSARLLETRGDDCEIHELHHHGRQTQQEAREEADLYLKAMRIFCDLKSGAALEDDYVWPDLRST